MGFLQPEAVVGALDITQGMRVADFGSGSGHWALAFAKRVGSGGKVYAFDILETALEAVRSRAALERLHTVEAIRANLEVPGATKLRNELVDLVLFSNILFQADEKGAMIDEAWRILKPLGRAAVIEWDTANTLAGPPRAQRIARQDMARLFEEHRFALAKEFAAGAQHYGLLFRKQT